jgi:hypothetical protein
MEQTQCSETSAIKHPTLENNPKDYMRGSFHVIKKIKVPLEIIVNSEAGHLNAIAIVLITLKFYTYPYGHFHLE